MSYMQCVYVFVCVYVMTRDLVLDSNFGCTARKSGCMEGKVTILRFSDTIRSEAGD